MTTIHGTVTYSVPQAAFGGAPAAMKDGDIVAFCAETVDSGGQSTTTISQFSDLGQPAATDTPQSGKGLLGTHYLQPFVHDNDDLQLVGHNRDINSLS